MHCLPRYLPFQEWDEWITVKDGLYSNNPEDRGRAVQIVEVWRSRGKVPHSVDSTTQMVEIGLSSSGWRSDMESRLLYTTAITRAINGLADNKQQGEHAEAVSKIASSMGIPGWIVGVRHDGTHNELPSLPVLRVAATTMLGWFQENYWTPQYDLLLQLSNICIPPSLQQSKVSVLIPNTSLDNPSLNFDSSLEKSSTTFVSDSFIPVFVAGCIKIPLKNADPATFGNQGNVAKKTVEKQKKHWLHYLTKVLTVRSANMHTVLSQLLAVLVDVGSVSVSNNINDEDSNEVFELTQWHVELSVLWINEVVHLIQLVQGLPPVKQNNNNNSSTTLIRSSSTSSLNGVNLTSSCRVSAGELSLFYPLIDTVLLRLQDAVHSRFSGSFLSQCNNKLIRDSVAGVCASVRALYLNNMTETDRKSFETTLQSAALEQTAVETGDGVATCAAIADKASSSSSSDTGGSGALSEMEQFLAGLSGGGKAGGPTKKKQKLTTLENTSSSSSSSSVANAISSSSSVSVAAALATVRYASLTSVAGVKSACGGEGGVRVCADYPVWPLGMLPGQTSGNALLDLELVDSRNTF